MTNYEIEIFKETIRSECERIFFEARGKCETIGDLREELKKIIKQLRWYGEIEISNLLEKVFNTMIDKEIDRIVIKKL